MDNRLPNLIIAGVSKGGTTALADYLGQHSDVCLARSQEVFYALARGAPEAEILRYRRGFRHMRDERYLCEHGATYYFGGQDVIDTIKIRSPDARIVFSVRDPADRLWSAYNYKKSKFRLARDMRFEEFLSESERRLKAGHDTVPDHVWRELAIGFYNRTIVPWLDTFGERARVVFFEEWTKNPKPAMEELCRWLDIAAEPMEEIDYSAHNRTMLHRSRVVKEGAYGINRSLGHFLNKSPALKKSLRQIYYVANARRVSEHLQLVTRKRVRELYRVSNAEFARALEAHGYKELPRWLREPAF